MSSSHGSLLAVVPGVLGLMAFSPELDACGNPWRAVHFCQVRHLRPAAPTHLPNYDSSDRRSWYQRFSCTVLTSGRRSGRFWPTGNGRQSQRLVLLLWSTFLLAGISTSLLHCRDTRSWTCCWPPLKEMCRLWGGNPIFMFHKHISIWTVLTCVD